MDGDGILQPVTLSRHNSTSPKKQSFIPRNHWAKLALGVAFAQCIIACILEFYILITNQSYLASIDFPNPIDKGKATALLGYYILFLVAQVYQLLLLMDALMQLSLIQLVTTTTFNWLFFGYSIVQYFQAAGIVVPLLTPNPHPTKTMEILLSVVMLFFAVSGSFLCWKLYYVFGWTTYKELGADITVRNVLYLYHIYILLLKLDVFFFFSVQFQFIFLNVQPGTNFSPAVNMIVSSIGALGLLILAYFAVRKESQYLVYGTLVAFVVGIGYLFTNLEKIWFSQKVLYSSSKNSFTLLIIATIILSVVTMAVAVLNMQKFGQGLINRLASTTTVIDEESHAFEVRR
ncbi:hypothetical protein BC833DRAFT_585229 [Globomyces pollinis-pini]|nr:hypothetical protein BC833DRAFT_585229 [Globomyces pollinis-pini]